MSDQTRISILARVQNTQIGSSWNEFAEIYDGLIQGWLSRQNVQSQDADDIRQEVMTVVYRKISQFEHNGRTGAFRSWLKNITSNCLRDHWKKRKRQGGVAGPDLEQLADQLADSSSQQSVMWNAEHDRHVLSRMLDHVGERLSEKSVSVFKRIVIGQEEAEEVATDFGMTLGAARVAQHRVLKALKELGEGLVDDL